jgi:hypothetical protein
MVEIGDLCEALMLTSDGRFDTSVLEHISRKRFCQFLGIGESTLVGWIQTGKIPRAAAIAFVLYQNLLERSREAQALTLASLEPRVISQNGKFAVCEFKKRDDNELEGHIVASEIANFGTAYALAKGRSQKFKDLLNKASDTLSAYSEQDPEVLDFAKDISVALSKHATLVTDYAAYIREKNITLSDLFPEDSLNSSEGDEQPKEVSS